MDTLLHDLKHALRLLSKDKGFTATVLLTLAVTIGAHTAVFSVVSSVLLESLPFPEPERIVLMTNSYPGAGVVRASNGVPDYYDRLREVDVFEEQALYVSRGRSIEMQGLPERIDAMQVTPSFFRLLRAKPELGRTFTEEEGTIGNERRILLSHGLWQQLFAGRPDAVGQDLRIDGELYRIVGVMPESFSFVEAGTRLWTPLAFTEEQKSVDSRHSNNWEMIGRLAPGRTLEQAQAQLDALNARNLERFPQFREILVNAGFKTLALGFQDDLVRDVASTLYLLWGGVFCVLLVGCVNLANLVLVRANVRLRELSTRVALGAGHRRLTRQLLTESVLLTLTGGALGLFLGYWGLDVLRTLGLAELPRGAEIAIDGTTIAVTLGLAVALGSVLGLIPVVGVLRADLNAVLREEGRGGTAGRGARLLRRGLVVAQVAFAFMLLVGAGLLLTSFREILAVEPGFEPEGVLSATLVAPRARYAEDDALRSLVARTLEQVRALPGVSSAGATDVLPWSGSYSDSVILAEGYVMQPGESLISPDAAVVSPGYFETMGISLRAGRLLDERDDEKAQKVVIVDETLARKFWPGADPIGRRMFRPGNPENLLDPGPNPTWLTVVGVVGDVKLRGLVSNDSRVGAYYFPFAQQPSRFTNFVVKTTGDPIALAAAMRKVVALVDPELPLFDVRTMKERLAQTLLERRAAAMLTAGFGLAALLLAAIGLYGVLAYLVTRRTREIGIRIALGSTGRRIFELILHEGLVMLGLGLALGLSGAVALRGALASQLYGVGALDPRVLGAGAAVLAAVAFAASALPAMRAARIDPVEALGG